MGVDISHPKIPGLHDDKQDLLHAKPVSAAMLALISDLTCTFRDKTVVVDKQRRSFGAKVFWVRPGEGRDRSFSRETLIRQNIQQHLLQYVPCNYSTP